MSTDLSRQRCLHHPEREAVARCPECQQFYCRECITEHEDRVLCTACLKKLVKPRSKTRIRLAWIIQASQLFLGFFVVWLFFYLCGGMLLAIPAKYHDGSFWKSDTSDSDR